MTLASAVLLHALLTNDFRFAYVAEHSNRTLPTVYKFAAWWSGQEGSLMFWSWLLATYAAVVVFTNRRKHRDMMPYVVAVLSAVQTFFLLMNNFVANPFQMLAVDKLITSVPDGSGLSPLLQYPAMAIHPPMLYLGYVGFAVPFAFAIGSLITRQPGEGWIHTTRRWTLITWLFQGTGIMLGAAWAYHVLGWGGYWGWDPVENASFMPWLTGTAFLHSVMMQEKKGMMKTWNVWLIFSTFLLTLLGTLLTRAGLVSSVHAFAQSSIGNWFVAFMVIVLVVCVFTYVLQRRHLRSEHHLESLVSRESSFLFNNMVLLAACFVILWGTLFPILSEYVTGSKVTVGAPWYNREAVPIGIFLLFLTGVGPLLPWRATSLKSIRRNFVVPVIALWVTVLVCLVAGVRPWRDGAFDSGSFYSLVAFAVSVGVFAAIVMEFLRGGAVIAKQTGRNLLVATWLLTRRNTRRCGGYIVHIGVVIVVVGLAGAAFNRSVEQELALHDKLVIGPYTLQCVGFTQDSNSNYNSDYALLDVYRGGQKSFQLTPEKRVYLASGQPQTMVAIHSIPSWDLYVVYEGTNPDTGQPIIKAFLNPLVGWIWAGVALMVFGTLVALVPSQKPAAPTPARTAKEERNEPVQAL
jgi:cytochrome c-type biogenesis protein CcmF